MQSNAHHRVLIIGGGMAGITVAARLRRAKRQLDLAIIEPSDKHYYQPLWTLVGAGIFPKEASQRAEERYIPKEVVWMRDAVSELLPAENAVRTRDGKTISYDFLVVAPGIQVNWGQVKGLKDAIGKGGVCSNYSYQYVHYTWECIRNFKGGNAIFTMPNTPVKCGGAPQKIMYLAEEYFRRTGVRVGSRVLFASATPKIFSVPKFAEALTKVLTRDGIETWFRHNLVEIRPDEREALFENLDTHESIVLPYNLIHVTPPQSAPDFVRNSPLADEAGWVEVDKHTLQHVRYCNVFSLGDASNSPTSKTGSAVRDQAPVVVKNLLAVMRQESPAAHYEGYTACPIPTGYGKLILAEFDYDLSPKETFPFDQAKERWSMWLLKKYGLPWMYWNLMLKGRM